MRDLIMLVIGIFIGVIYLANEITFEDKCKLSGGDMVDNVCILDNN